MANLGPPLGSWQFGSMGMLLWGLAAALPILIHLWSRQRHRRETWAAMSFLLAALRRNARRIQIEQWLLLTLRTAILLLFALALANPRLSDSSPRSLAAGSGQTQVVLVIDGSYSMDFRQDGQSRFDAAKEEAKLIVERAEEGSGYMLMLMGEPPRVLISQPAYNRKEVLNEIESLELSHAGANLPATLAEVETLLLRAGERLTALKRQSRGRVCFFTDLQQATWGEANSADCRARLGRLANLASLELIDLGQPGAENLAVSRLTMESAGGGLAVANSAVQIQAEIQSFAHEDRVQHPVEVLVDGQRIADQRIDLPPRGRANVSITHSFALPGDHMIEVDLSDDDLPLDNRRWLSVPVRESIRVLCIGGRPTEARHIKLALAPQNRASGQIELTEIPESRLLEEELTRFDCVFLCNIGRFSQGEAAALHRYVSGGGGLIVFLGDQVQAASYNLHLVEDGNTRILPARLEEPAPTSVPGYRLNPLEYRHSIVAPFRGFTQSGLLTTPIWKYMRLKALEGSTAVLDFDNRDPAIVETAIGRGRAILVATAASPDSLDRAVSPPLPWTALPSWPSFPPLIHEMLRFVLTARVDERNITVGDELKGLFSGSIGDEPVTVTGPDGINERLLITQNGTESRWSYGVVGISGAYAVQGSNSVQQANAAQRFAVNVDPRESDLVRFDPDLLPSQLRREPGIREQLQPPNGLGGSTSYFRQILAAVLLLLVAEPVLAWQFGRGSA